MSEVNVWLVLAAAIANVLIGTAWYSDYLFGVRWLTIFGKTKAEMQAGSSGSMVTSAFASMVTAYILAVMIHYSNNFGVIAGVKTGLLIWLGFVALTSLPFSLFEKRPWGLYLIHTSYQLIAFASMGAIIGAGR